MKSYWGLMVPCKMNRIALCVTILMTSVVGCKQRQKSREAGLSSSNSSDRAPSSTDGSLSAPGELTFDSKQRQYLCSPSRDFCVDALLIVNSLGRTLTDKVTNERGQAIRLAMQDDCNLVIYVDGRAVWQSESGVAGKTGCVLKMQDDGNLVVYAPNNEAVWNLGAAGGQWETTCKGNRDIPVECEARRDCCNDTQFNAKKIQSVACYLWASSAQGGVVGRSGNDGIKSVRNLYSGVDQSGRTKAYPDFMRANRSSKDGYPLQEKNPSDTRDQMTRICL